MRTRHYRIVTEKNGLGELRFVPQYRWAWLWWECGYRTRAGFHRYDFGDVTEAMQYIGCEEARRLKKGVVDRNVTPLHPAEVADYARKAFELGEVGDASG